MAPYREIKSTVFYLVVLLTVLSSCKKDDTNAFAKSPDDRINETLANYQTLLSGAPYGWKAVVYPTGGGAYSFYFKFSDANRVVMYADFDSLTAATPKESSYRLKALQQPSLIFDTYTYLHLLSDPNENTTNVQSDVNGFRGGTLGQGLQSDFEFAIDTATTDSVKLTGRQHGTKAYLMTATQEEAAAYNSGQLSLALVQLQNINKLLYYFKRLSLGGKVYDVSINDNAKTIAFTWINSNASVSTFTTTYYYTTEGILFSTPLNDGTQTITGFTGITWDANTTSFNITANNTAGTIVGVSNPIAVDKEAPIRWWNYAVSNGNTYWASENGFHVNGVDDAFGIKSLKKDTWDYFFLVYWPNYFSDADLFAPVFRNTERDSVTFFYGTAPEAPRLRSDGRVVFRELGFYPGEPFPTTGPAALSRDQLYNSGGYYFVQTSATSYDMVSAADSRIWITWEQ